MFLKVSTPPPLSIVSNMFLDVLYLPGYHLLYLTTNIYFLKFDPTNGHWQL